MGQSIKSFGGIVKKKWGGQFAAGDRLLFRALSIKIAEKIYIKLRVQ
jgi:hypothetical protein